MSIREHAVVLIVLFGDEEYATAMLQVERLSHVFRNLYEAIGRHVRERRALSWRRHLNFGVREIKGLLARPHRDCWAFGAA